MDVIDEFTEQKEGKAVYRSWLTKFFDCNNIKEIDSYFEQNRNYDDDVLKFAKYLSNEKYSPSARRGSISMVKNFFKFNNIRLQPKTEYSLREYGKGPSAISKERVPTQAELKEILSYGGIRHKALFLTMASSGMRPGEEYNTQISR